MIDLTTTSFSDEAQATAYHPPEGTVGAVHYGVHTNESKRRPCLLLCAM